MKSPNTEEDINRYSKGELIGKGNYSNAFKVKDNETNQFFAA